MNRREAFEKNIGHLLSPGKTKDRKWQDWVAACEFQKQRDAEICEKERADFDRAADWDDHACGAEVCRDAILHQDEVPGIEAAAAVK